MKKIFTLIAATLMAVGANAQTEEHLFFADGVAYTDGQVLTTTNCSITLGKDGKNASYTNKASKDLNSTKDFAEATNYISGGNNPKDSEGAAYSPDGKNVPSTGTYYILKPTVAGQMKVAMVLNSGKTFYVANSKGEYVSNKIYDNTDTEVTVTDYTIEAKTYGYTAFDVAAGDSYYVFCNGSKLGCYGYSFTPGTTSQINSVNTGIEGDAKTYNLGGQRVNESYKGVVIKNGKKMIQ